MLASLLKGRSSSPRINALLRQSLAVVLGHGIYGSYGFVPSLANPSDDPTRGEKVRRPNRLPPPWLYRAFEGHFEGLDRFLEETGYDPISVAGLPFSSKEPFCFERFAGAADECAEA